MIDCNEWRTEKRHECANMGKVKRLELWWQLYCTSLPVWDLENFRPMDFCWHECTSYYSNRALLWPFNVAGNNKAYVGPHVQCPIFLPDFNQIRLFSTHFHKPVNIKFHRNPSTESRNDACEQMAGQDEYNRHFSRSCERALKSSISIPLRKMGRSATWWYLTKA